MNTSPIAVNYCPSCGCNLRAVSLAIGFAERRAPTPPPNGVAEAPKRERSARVPYTPKLIDEIAKLRVSGMSIAQIANEAGLTKGQLNTLFYYGKYREKMKTAMAKLKATAEPNNKKRT